MAKIKLHTRINMVYVRRQVKLHTRIHRVYVRRQKAMEEQKMGWAPETPTKIPPQRLCVSEMKLKAQETASDASTAAASCDGDNKGNFDGSRGVILDLNTNIENFPTGYRSEERPMNYVGGTNLLCTDDDGVSNNGTELLNSSSTRQLLDQRKDEFGCSSRHQDQAEPATVSSTPPVKIMNHRSEEDSKKRSNTRKPPKRKRHKPKVVVEKRTPEPSTPKPATPKKAKENNSISSRKKMYSRKKKHPLDSDPKTPVVKLYHGEKRFVSVNGVRRALNYNRESCEDGGNKLALSLVPVGCGSLQEYQKLWREQLHFPKLCKRLRFKRRRKLHLFFWSDSMLVPVYKWCNARRRRPRTKLVGTFEPSEEPTSKPNLGEKSPPVEVSILTGELGLSENHSSTRKKSSKSELILKKAKPSRPNATPKDSAEGMCEGDMHAIIEKFRSLHINDGKEKPMKKARRVKGLKQKAKNINEGVLVPYEGSKKLVKKTKTAEVDLDPESLRVWKLLNDGDYEEKDFGNEEHWRKEQDTFKLRIDTFNARNFLIQGDRGFRQWKGSVVDSIIGVFLTQNVTDHYSSSAFMSLAARFPVKRTCTSDALCSQESVGSNAVPDRSTHDREGNHYFISEPEPESNSELEKSTQSLVSRTMGSLKIEDVTELNQGTHTSYINQGEKMNFDSDSCFGDQEGKSMNSQTKLSVDETLTKKRKRENQPKQHDSLDADRKVSSKGKKKNAEKRDPAFWENLRKECTKPGPRPADQMDSIDWEAIRAVSMEEVAAPIQDRGQQFQIAKRIKQFLDRMIQIHGIIDLEWLRNAPPDLTKEYLLEINGLGLKSVECVRLLSLKQVAFPVDTNVGRIAVRLGWVPLQPLPEGLLIHLLEAYPEMDSIQKYLWPRLRTLDQETLYELHYQLITFGKVFCTKINPNCNACPMKGECRHFASAFASARLSLPGPTNKTVVPTTFAAFNVGHPSGSSNIQPLQLETSSCAECRNQTKCCEPTIEEPFTLASQTCSGCRFQTNNCELAIEGPFALVSQTCSGCRIQTKNCEPTIEERFALASQTYPKCKFQNKNCEPIIEEPAELPSQEAEVKVVAVEEPEIEYDSEGIPIVKLNVERFQKNLLKCIDENGMTVQGGNRSKALVHLAPNEASIPVRKLKSINRLRTEHQVYELPENHYLMRELQLEELDPDDPLRYHLAIWQPGETKDSLDPPMQRCNFNEAQLCDDQTCFSCNSIREQDANVVRATILIPSRTANRGSFPLNGTYFQVNEVFADHETSENPIVVPRDMIYNLHRRTAYFGTSISSILKGQVIREIQKCFWKGIICVRAFDRTQRCPQPLVKRFHCSPSNMDSKGQGGRQKEKLGI